MTKSPITFHYISAHQKYAYDYFIYESRVYGRQIIQPPLPNKIIPPTLLNLDEEIDNNGPADNTEFFKTIKLENFTQENVHNEFK